MATFCLHLDFLVKGFGLVDVPLLLLKDYSIAASYFFGTIKCSATVIGSMIYIIALVGIVGLVAV